MATRYNVHSAGGPNRKGGDGTTQGQYSLGEKTHVVTAKPSCDESQKVSGQYSLSDKFMVVTAKPLNP